MFEATTIPEARRAMRLAHDARGEMVRNAWSWMFGPRKPR